MKLSIEMLEEFGFREYNKHQHDRWDRNWQFRKRDEKGTKFFVEVRLWEFSKYANAERTPEDSFDAQCNLDSSRSFVVSLSVSDMLPQQIIDWFDGIHTKLNCNYYELYENELYNEDGEKVSYNCAKCRMWLGDVKDSEFCEKCRYEYETGFVPVLRKKINKQ